MKDIFTHIRSLLTKPRDFSTFVASATDEDKAKALKRAADDAIRQQRRTLRKR